MKINLSHVSFIIMIILTSFGFSAQAQKESDSTWEVITVLGLKENEASLPGSGDSVNSQRIRQHSYDDIHRILRKIPGVYSREEDGLGLFPNIGFRGVDVSRSQKVTIMEDSITAAPAPYSSPAAYYAPTAGRMSRIEVLKGSSQIQYGPHTTGGVMNYISTQIPDQREVYLKTLYGSYNEVRVHGFIGDKIATARGRWGYLVEHYFRDTDGFKTIDTTADFRDGDKTGVIKTEPMLKLSWETHQEAQRYRKWEAKLGYTDMKANETYLGLTEEDFKKHPYQRYAATRFDNIDSENFRSYLRYLTEINESIMVSLTGYYSQFQRNWKKLHKVNGDDLSYALAKQGESLSILKGQAAGNFDVRNNNRQYAQWGYEGNINMDFSVGKASHYVEIGAGYHYDYVRRNQNTETYTQDASGLITSVSVSAPGTAGNRRQTSRAIRLYMRDRVEIGPWTIIPGVRYELIDYAYIDYDTTGFPDRIVQRETSRISVLAGGIGGSYQFSKNLSVFGGVHQGFSVPGPRDNARKALKEETSLTKEGGVRFHPTRALSTEFVYFHTSFQDLLVKDNIGGTGTGETENIGNIVSQGIEWKVQYDLGIARKKSFRNPYYMSFTYTDARLDGDSYSTDPDSIFSSGQDGNRVPYIPAYQLSIGAGIEFDQWGVFIDGTYVSETFTTANNVEHQLQADGLTPDARFGKTDEFFVVDLSGYYRINENAKMFINAHNIGDLEYIVSRQPHGPRPGKPLTVMVGWEMTF